MSRESITLMLYVIGFVLLHVAVVICWLEQADNRKPKVFRRSRKAKRQPRRIGVNARESIGAG